MSKTEIPSIRFHGFDDAWEQRKVNEIATEITRTDPESTAPVMMISAASGFIYQSEKYAFDNAGQSLQKYIVLRKGELAYNHGASKQKRYGSCFSLQLDEARVPFVYHCFEVGQNNPDFIAIELNSTKIDVQLRRLVSSGCRMDGLLNISYDDYATMEIPIPQRSEQDKISLVFSNLDRLITLHQRKLEKLTNVKKSMLEKMFPQNGSSYPEIRFKGFTDPWEQRKLGELAPLRGGFAFQSQEYCTEGVPIVKISNILSDGMVGGEFDYYAELKDDHEFTLPNGAAVLAMSGATTGKVAILLKESNQKYYQNQRVGYFTSTRNVEYSFITTIVRSDLFIEQLKSVLVAGAQPNVSPKDIDSFEFSFPKAQNEQHKIGQFFQSLDRLITLHQRELEKLQNIKKSMLEKMFV